MRRSSSLINPSMSDTRSSSTNSQNTPSKTSTLLENHMLATTSPSSLPRSCPIRNATSTLSLFLSETVSLIHLPNTITMSQWPVVRVATRLFLTQVSVSQWQTLFHVASLSLRDATTAKVSGNACLQAFTVTML